MEGLVKGDVVVMTFPFSDLTGVKRRPAVVLAPLEGEDVILCQITSKRLDKYGIPLSRSEFKRGSLSRDSVIRPNKLFTGARSVITRKAGTLTPRKLSDVVNAVCRLIRE
ncbi:type II toxin-antitoxin system PemK/MazF family toxin [Candidatus Woesearchaeota archaeon]|nr:type II toxin-antitoxin system PemK/MazF family toxin [Candidatus Woesearchaeota archaeon]